MNKKAIVLAIAAGLVWATPVAPAQASRLFGTWQQTGCNRGGEGVSWMRPRLVIGPKTIGQYVDYFSDEECSIPESTYLSREGTYVMEKQSEDSSEFELSIYYDVLRYIVRAKLRIDKDGLHLSEQHHDGKEVWVTYGHKAPEP